VTLNVLRQLMRYDGAETSFLADYISKHSAGKTAWVLAGSTLTPPALTMAAYGLRLYRPCQPAPAAVYALVDGSKIAIVSNSTGRWPILVISASAPSLSMPSMLSANLSTCA
jgi:hypothetical protein